MANPVPFSKVADEKKNRQETDRTQIKKGDLFVITSIFIDENTRYDAIAKINGYDLIGNNQVKKRTTSKKIISQCKDILNVYGSGGKLTQEVKVMVQEYTTENGQQSLEFVDPK